MIVSALFLHKLLVDGVMLSEQSFCIIIFANTDTWLVAYYAHASGIVNGILFSVVFNYWGTLHHSSVLLRANHD